MRTRDQSPSRRLSLQPSLFASPEDERKLLCQLLPKLHIPEEIPDIRAKSLLWLISSLKVVRVDASYAAPDALAYGSRLFAPARRADLSPTPCPRMLSTASRRR